MELEVNQRRKNGKNLLAKLLGLFSILLAITSIILFLYANAIRPRYGDIESAILILTNEYDKQSIEKSNLLFTLTIIINLSGLTIGMISNRISHEINRFGYYGMQWNKYLLLMIIIFMSCVSIFNYHF
jgi:hypothetical protein